MFHLPDLIKFKQMKIPDFNQAKKQLSPESGRMNVAEAISGKKNDHTSDLENSYLMLVYDLHEKIAGLKKLAEQQSREKSQIIASNNRFISIIGHDLRGPISSILGVLSLLKEFLYDIDKKEIEEYVDIASASAINTANLLENLLLWSTSQNTGVIINKKVIELAALVEEEITDSKITTRLKKINITNTIDFDLKVCVDKQMLKTIFRNLINNATKFTNTGGQITISAIGANRFAEIRVEDNGRGIAPEDLNSVFLLDAVIPEKTKNREKGRGLGLLLCKEFVEMHGGTISVESTPGKGSSFLFTIPLHVGE
jgi:two-component system, sensor histidine kinase and response regulator